MTDESAISIRGLAKRFGKVAALQGVDLEVPRGAAVGLVGPEGAGKSTLVRVLAGLARPNAGSATILGSRAGTTASRLRVGFLLQDAASYGWMRGRDVLAFAAELAGVEGPKIAGRIAETAALLGVEAALGPRVSELPAGMRDRLGLAQAIVGDPEVLVLDAPFDRLEPEVRTQVLRVLAGLRGAKTILLAGRPWVDVRAVCDRVAVLDAGRIVFDGSAADLAGRVAPVWVVETLGAPGLALAGVVARLRAEPWVTEVSATGGTLRVSTPDAERAARELLPALIGAGVAVSALRRDEASFEQLVAGIRRP